MDNEFDLPVTYKDKEYLFPASLTTSGYTYRINVDVFGNNISFEPDEERNFRALINYEELQDAHQVDKALLEEIAATLVALFS